MRELRLEATNGSSLVRTGDTFGSLGEYVDLSRCLAVTDRGVHAALGDRFPACPVFVMASGERSKSLSSTRRIYERLVELEADRTWWILGIGGGVVSDLCGFVASTYMRGMRCAFVPTTVLAQVDASVGGKNGVNFGPIKNLVGTFLQPELVLCDPGLLRSLPESRYREGFAEVVKHAVLADETYFELIGSSLGGIRARDHRTLEAIIHRSIEIKAAVVERDPRESGLRRCLNLGHTIGHGVELVAGLPHGFAVSVGIHAACILSRRKGFLESRDEERVYALLESLGLPRVVRVDEVRGRDRSGIADAMLRAVRHDKKRTGDVVQFVYPERIGSTRIEAATFAEIRSVLEEVLV